jgi:uroporphyrinogen decarboxylase
MLDEARRKCEEAKERIEQQVEAGADFLILAYDFGFNDGPFISPEQFGEFVAPFLAEIVDAIHRLGKRALLHSDGNISLLLDQIHATGIDGYQSIDPQGNMDIREVRERYPDWTLMGNVNSGMLQFTDEERIRESVRYCMTHGGMGKRYIFSTSNCIFDGMPAESYRVMLDEYRRIIDEASNPSSS